MTYSLDNARSLLALVFIILVCWLFSENKRRFPVGLMVGAIALQGGLVALIFALPNAQPLLAGISGAVEALASATRQGTQFVFNYLGGGDQPWMAPGASGAPPFIFGFQVLPLIVVIAALSALMWHIGILKWVIRGFGFLFSRTMGLGGASATAVASNIFLGNVESSIVIKAYLEKLTRSEIFMVMTVGLAGVAGSTMVAYATILKDVLPNAAGHVLVASIISAPAGVLLARIMVPPNADEKSQDVDYGASLKYDSAMDAITRGVGDGVMVAVNVGATLIVFVAFVALVNSGLGALPDVAGAKLSLERVFGFAFAPLAWLIGVPWEESQKAGDLLGVKLFLTEFVAYIKLGAIPAAELSDRTRMIMTYALCGFANVASVGITVGGLTQLYPVERRPVILELAWKALLPGFLATLMTAAIVAAMPAGMFAK
ncbi:MAG: NupC/NupG family nucleoside CNT transporter [Caulobacterales bacterium]